jgi:PHD/YefM family antitoxin component YafN of YafNO toxin-antitoxin module
MSPTLVQPPEQLRADCRGAIHSTWDLTLEDESSNIATFGRTEASMNVSERTITTLSSREFNQDTARAKRAAKKGPVFITTRGEPSHVLMSIEEYRRLEQEKSPGRSRKVLPRRWRTRGPRLISISISRSSSFPQTY